MLKFYIEVNGYQALDYFYVLGSAEQAMQASSPIHDQGARHDVSIGQSL